MALFLVLKYSEGGMKIFWSNAEEQIQSFLKKSEIEITNRCIWVLENSFTVKVFIFSIYFYFSNKNLCIALLCVRK